jgi:Ca-activated chloride channel family protein
MFWRWVDPHVRSSVALGTVLLCIAGLVLASGQPLRASEPADSRHLDTPSPLSWIGGLVDDSPRTSLTFQGRGAHGRIALSHGRLLASGRRQLFAEITLAADESEPSEARAPVSFVLAIDTSGSMAGRKLADAREAALWVLQQLRGDDEVAVVRFSSSADVVVPLTRVGSGRWQAREAIERMRAGGNTDIANALRSAANLLGAVSDRSQRIVVVTDGRDTSGAPRTTASRVARYESARGITVSALGIGSDYDDDYLGDLADAGRGNYEFLRDSSALSDFVSKELREATQTTVRQARVELRLPAGARVHQVSGAGWELMGEHARLDFGSLFTGDERRAVITLEVETGEAGGRLVFGGEASWQLLGAPAVSVALPTLRVEVVSSRVAVEQARDHSVWASAVSVEASQTELAAAQAFERGDRAKALELNRRSQARLSEAAQAAPPKVASRLHAQRRAYKRDAQAYQSQAPSAAAARSIGARERRNFDRAAGF